MNAICAKERKQKLEDSLLIINVNSGPMIETLFMVHYSTTMRGKLVRIDLTKNLIDGKVNKKKKTALARFT